MPAVAGRGTEARTVTITTTNASAAITGAAGTFQTGDKGRKITAAAGIPANATILSVQSPTAATLSANATQSGSRSATILTAAEGGGEYGYIGWSPESDAEAASLTLAGGANDSTRIPNITTERSDHRRSRS